MAEVEHNRRSFIKLAGAGILIGTVYLWDRLVKQQQRLSHPQQVSLPFNPNQEVTFHNRVVIVNHNSNTSVFSSRCTHLGCTINHVESGVMVCPCHGSRYDLQGKPLKGPAIRPLQELDYQIDNGKKQITISL